MKWTIKVTNWNINALNYTMIMVIMMCCFAFIVPFYFISIFIFIFLQVANDDYVIVFRFSKIILNKNKMTKQVHFIKQQDFFLKFLLFFLQIANVHHPEQVLKYNLSIAKCSFLPLFFPESRSQYLSVCQICRLLSDTFST